MLKEQREKLPDMITSYDLLKMTAVILMIVDHIGTYFYPDDLWFRAIGRLCVPMWFFLIGYARSRDLSAPIWWGVIVLFITSVIFGMYILPLSILATIIFVRIVIDRVGSGALSSMQSMAGVMIGAALIAFPTGILGEYGTLGVSLAVFGYMIRARQDGREISMDMQMICLVMASIGFVIIQQLTFGFSDHQFLFIGFGSFIVMGVLFFFSYAEFPFLSASLGGVLKKMIQFMGRRTLEIYVAHLVLFRIAGVFLYPDRFKIIQPEWIFSS